MLRKHSNFSTFLCLKNQKLKNDVAHWILYFILIFFSPCEGPLDALEKSLQEAKTEILSAEKIISDAEEEKIQIQKAIEIESKKKGKVSEREKKCKIENPINIELEALSNILCFMFFSF